MKRKKGSWKKIILILLAVLILIGIAAFFLVRHFFMPQNISNAQGADAAVVQTGKGSIRGSLEGGIYQYLGVPYAKASERFVPADELESWDGILDATECGPMSPQSGMLGMSAGSQEGTDNNCQNLNIWTPGIGDGQKRAVMVWLHGGGFSTGSANSEQYNGENLSRKGDVVVVSINHRLGVSGFLDLSAYGEKYRYSANAGIMDIQMALAWIQDNIEYFGGNPENVTIFGQSGGGAKALSMMTSPYAKGLFHRGIVQSGATETMGVTFTSQEASTYLTERILKRLGVTGERIEELQDIDLKQLEDASQKALQETAEKFQIPAPLDSGYAMEWGPVIDGDYMPQNPVTEDSFAENGKDVELLIGSNLNEWTGMMGSSQEDLTPEEIQAFEDAYPNEDPDNANMVDTLIRLPMLKIMSHKAAQGGADVYAYVFAWNESRMGAYHGAEIPFVFADTQGNEAQQRLADQISEAWINFAKTGTPSAEGLPVWEPYTKDSGATMILDTDSVMAYHHDKELMELLEPDYEY